MNAMRGGGFFTYFRNHLKAWISLAVVTQCLFLIWYHRQAFLLAQDLVALWKQQNVRLVQQSGIRIGIQIKDHAEQHSRESSTNNSLQTAPKILSRKIDGEIDLENVNADKPPEDGLTISSELHHEQNLNRTKSGGGVSALSKPSEAFSHNKVALAKESKNLKPQIRKSLKNIPHGITYDPQAFNSSTKYTFNTIQKTKQGFYPSFVSIPQLFELNSVSPTTKYFEPRQFGNNTYQCYKAGTKTKAPSGDEPCSCEKGWHGKWCSFPDCFSNSAAARFSYKLRLRKHRRRIVNFITFNMEWEQLEARMHELNASVDLFILLESNYTLYGEPKSLQLLERFTEGYLREYHHKILYLFLDHFPEGGREDGWLAEDYTRTFLSLEGDRRIIGLNLDDLVMYTDADEIPTHGALEFLALHDGYPEPFSFALRWSTYGFFWRNLNVWITKAGCTVRMLREVLHNKVYLVRGTKYRTTYAAEWKRYLQKGASFVQDWVLGDKNTFAGWHCSWCFSPDRIKIKLTSAINADFPRWGDYPEKLDLNYIRNLTKKGMWFDNKTKFGSLVNSGQDPHFAPQYLLDNFEKYKTLLDFEAI